MIRFGFTARLLTIFLLSVVGLQIIMVMIYFTERSRGTERPFRYPLPDQVAALVELFETAHASQRDLLLRAANSSELSVSLVREKPDLRPETWQPSEFIEKTVRGYLAVIGEREVTVLLQPEQGAPKRYGPGAMIYPASARILVNLKTGETLDISTTGILSIRIFGWPPGFWAGIFGLVMTILVYFSVRGEAKPLRELAKAADSFDFDKGGSPLPERRKGAPEIQALIRAFNRMQNRISFLVKARLALVGGISHDLKTYATRLLLRVSFIEDQTERARAVSDIESMIKLLDDSLLALAGKDNNSQLDELVDICALLTQDVEDWRARGHDVELENDTAKEKACLVLGREVALRRLFSNLIVNAVTYGFQARIGLSSRLKVIAVTVDDAGPGIPENQREAVFEPFVRLEHSRNRRTGGAGLGLAIVRNIAEAHGGSVSVSHSPQGGARFTVILPLFSADSQR